MDQRMINVGFGNSVVASRILAVVNPKSSPMKKIKDEAKERKKLIMVPRETPFSNIHLENMLKLSQMGAVILPAAPGFYNKPKKIEDIIDFMAARILDHLGIEQTLQPKWGE